MKIEKRKHGDCTELLVNGQVVSRAWARPDLPGYLAIDKIDMYREAGIRIHFVSMHQPQLLFWDGGDYYYPEQLSAFLEWICKYDEKALLIPYIGFRTSGPYKWIKNHLDECTLLSNGERYDAPSVASQQWRRDVREAIARIVRHLEESAIGERILGFNFVQGANEWFAYSAFHLDPWRQGFADYSEPFQQYFREFVQRRYAGDEQALRKAWKDANISFDRVEVPSVDERLQFGHEGMFYARDRLGLKLTDFYHAWHQAWAELAEFYCRTAKEAASRE
ncbi:MAG: hypothetical protein D6820_14745, partial [Lentisphaerae bacterium]